MKTLQLLLLLTAVSLFSCNKDEERDAVADYKVLGITSVTVNGQEFQVKNGVLLDVANTQSIAADGILVQSMETQVTYVVLIAKGVIPSVEVKSSYADVLMIAENETINGHASCTVSVSRSGYQEQLTYVFSFIGLE